jgi:hypothetical protein
MKITVSWDTGEYSLIDIDRGFGEAYWLHFHPDEDGIKLP